MPKIKGSTIRPMAARAGKPVEASTCAGAKFEVYGASVSPTIEGSTARKSVQAAGASATEIAKMAPQAASAGHLDERSMIAPTANAPGVNLSHRLEAAAAARPPDSAASMRQTRIAIQALTFPMYSETRMGLNAMAASRIANEWVRSVVPP